MPMQPLRDIRLVGFDLDGTLVDSSRDLASAVNAMLDEVRPGTPALSHAAVRSFIGDGARNLVDRSLRAAGLDAPVEQALPAFLAAYSARLLDTTRLYPGIPELLDALGGRALAVLTNKPGGFSRTILEGLGVLPRFARVLGGDEVERKPAPGGLLRLLRELEVPAAAAAFVGDSVNDVLTARAAGVACVGVTWGFDTERLLAASPERVVDAPAQLLACLPPLSRSC